MGQAIRPIALIVDDDTHTPAEVEKLMAAVKGNRQGHRDATMILVAFRHGLRAAELVHLQWSQVDFPASRLHVRRVKQGTPATHPLTGVELRALRQLQREAPQSKFVFVSERGAPFSTAGFAKLIERAGTEAGFKFKVHAHMLRHACGYALANAGHDTRSLQAYLGHRNIQHTVRYTELRARLDRASAWRGRVDFSLPIKALSHLPLPGDLVLDLYNSALCQFPLRVPRVHPTPRMKLPECLARHCDNGKK
jgi:integrase